MSDPSLSPAQAHALFDILTHYETYSEIESFKWPDAINKYGHPFNKEDGVAATSPILQTLLKKFALKLPGLKDVSPTFWKERCQKLVEELGAAGLSESYDRGAIGSRKTLATAISAILENLARGAYGGYPQRHVDSKRKYDSSNAEEVVQAWDDFLQKAVYGDMIDECFEKMKKTDRLDDHPPLVQAAHEYILVNLASFLHHTLILSPDGQSLLRIMENVHRLVPYTIIRQTLKVGNAATMISGMVRLVLAKISLSSVTNWLGVTKSADEGMNLLQQIVSTVMTWDNTEFEKRASRIEKDSGSADQQHFDAIKKHVKESTREQSDKRRATSQEELKSLIAVIFEESSINGEKLTDEQMSQCMEYLNLHLSIRDREKLSGIFCTHKPDLLTEAVRDIVNAYDPVIRQVHNAVDLSTTLWDFECFFNDLLKLSKLPTPNKRKRSQERAGNGGGTPAGSRPGTPGPSPVSPSTPIVPANKTPSVEDYVKLLRKHIHSSHKFLHQVAKNGPEVTKWFQDYAHEAAAQFREPAETAGLAKAEKAADEIANAGAMTLTLNQLFFSIDPDKHDQLKTTLDQHERYLHSLQDASTARLKAILSNKSTSTNLGPGMYLARWQDLVDRTPITPATYKGPLRYGNDKSVRDAARRGVEGEKEHPGDESEGVKEGEKELEKEATEQPNVEDIVKLLQGRFRDVLAGGVE